MADEAVINADTGIDAVVENNEVILATDPEEVKAFLESGTYPVTIDTFVWVGRRQNYVSAARYLLGRY